MKALHEIRQEIEPTLNQVERLREEKLAKSKKARSWHLISLGLLLGGLASIMVGDDMLVLGIILLIVAIIAAVLIHIYVVRAPINKFKEEFKEQVLKQFVRALYPSMDYSPKRHISQSDFSISQLFSSFNRYSGEDYFEGSINEQSIRFSELSVKKRTRDSDGDSRTSTVFKGLFFILGLKNQVYGRVAVLPDAAESMLGGVGKFLQKTFGKMAQGGSLVHFEEDQAFEKAFVVYSKEPEEARRLLQPALRRNLLELKTRWNRAVRMSFMDNQVFVAISSNENFFEIDPKQSVLENAMLQGLYEELAQCLELIEFLTDNNPSSGSNDLPNHPTPPKNNPFLT